MPVPVAPPDESGGGARELYDLIRVAADIRPGDSGGPVLDTEGRLVGVVYAAEHDTRLALAVPGLEVRGYDVSAASCAFMAAVRSTPPV